MLLDWTEAEYVIGNGTFPRSLSWTILDRKSWEISIGPGKPEHLDSREICPVASRKKQVSVQMLSFRARGLGLSQLDKRGRREKFQIMQAEGIHYSGDPQK